MSDERKQLADDCRRIASIIQQWANTATDEWRAIYSQQANGAKRCADLLAYGDPCIANFTEGGQ